MPVRRIAAHASDVRAVKAHLVDGRLGRGHSLTARIRDRRAGLDPAAAGDAVDVDHDYGGGLHQHPHLGHHMHFHCSAAQRA